MVDFNDLEDSEKIVQEDLSGLRSSAALIGAFDLRWFSPVCGQLPLQCFHGLISQLRALKSVENFQVCEVGSQNPSRERLNPRMLSNPRESARIREFSQTHVRALEFANALKFDGARVAARMDLKSREAPGLSPRVKGPLALGSRRLLGAPRRPCGLWRPRPQRLGRPCASL